MWTLNPYRFTVRPYSECLVEALVASRDGSVWKRTATELRLWRLATVCTSTATATAAGPPGQAFHEALGEAAFAVRLGLQEDDLRFRHVGHCARGLA